MVANGCTFWPDSLLGQSYRICCDGHDLAYFNGLPKAQADWALVECVMQATGNVAWAFLMGAGVAVFGWLFYKPRNPPNNR